MLDDLPVPISLKAVVAGGTVVVAATVAYLTLQVKSEVTTQVKPIADMVNQHRVDLAHVKEQTKSTSESVKETQKSVDGMSSRIDRILELQAAQMATGQNAPRKVSVAKAREIVRNNLKSGADPLEGL